MNGKIDKLLKITYQYTYQSKHQKFPMAAILADKNKIYSIGINSYKTHPKQDLRWSYELNGYYGNHHLHAELDCLIKASYNHIQNNTVYIVRRTAQGTGCAKPCALCEELLKNHKIKKIIYSQTGELSSNGNIKSFAITYL